MFTSLRISLLVAAFCLFVITAQAAGSDLAGSRPNIILIMPDDMGYADLACHGNPLIQTPNLDRLASQSVRFTDFHVSPTCAPTRSALMTGRHEFKNGVTHTINERERLTLEAATIAQVLQRAGYATGIFGKWHLGDEEPYQPTHRGFDEAFIHGAGGIGQSYPGSCGDVPNNKYFDPVIRHNGRFVPTQGYCTDVFFTQALNWIEQERKADRPFFAYITPNAPHSPLVSPGEKYDQLYKGKLIDGKELKASDVAYYAMITNIDDNVGRLLDKLAEWHIDRDTLVIFLSDNGGTHTHLYNAGRRGRKGTVYHAGTQAPSFWHWPSKLANSPSPVRGHNKSPFPVRSENKSPSPVRGGGARGGGNSVPEATNRPALTAHIDLFRTLAELAGAKLTPAEDRQAEGRSLVPLLEDPNADWPDRTLVTHLGRWPRGEAAQSKYANCSIRNTRYRLVNNRELYDLQTDPGETTNVLADHPKVVAELRAAYDRWWQEVQPQLVNEDAVGPEENPYKVLYLEQLAGRKTQAAAGSN